MCSPFKIIVQYYSEIFTFLHILKLDIINDYSNLSICDSTSYVSLPCWLFNLQQWKSVDLLASALLRWKCCKANNILRNRQEYLERLCNYFLLSVNSYSMPGSNGIIKMFSFYSQLSVPSMSDMTVTKHLTDDWKMYSWRLNFKWNWSTE